MWVYKTSDKVLKYLQQNEYITTKIASEILALFISKTREVITNKSAR